MRKYIDPFHAPPHRLGLSDIYFNTMPEKAFWSSLYEQLFEKFSTTFTENDKSQEVLSEISFQLV